MDERKTYTKWNDEERAMLIRKRQELNDVFMKNWPNPPPEAWKGVSKALEDAGMYKGVTPCRTQWQSLMRKYRDFFEIVMVDGVEKKKASEQARHWPLFDVMHECVQVFDHYEGKSDTSSSDDDDEEDEQQEANEGSCTGYEYLDDDVEVIEDRPSTSSRASTSNSPAPRQQDNAGCKSKKERVKKYEIWTYTDRIALIKKRTEFDGMFPPNNYTARHAAWQAISRELADQGVFREWQHCRTQWKALSHKYRSFLKYPRGNQTGEPIISDEAFDWEYFKLMHEYACLKNNCDQTVLVPTNNEEDNGVLTIKDEEDDCPVLIRRVAGPLESKTGVSLPVQGRLLTRKTLEAPLAVRESTNVSNVTFGADISEKERRFCLKAYPDLSVVNSRRVHCTVCKKHLGTAIAQESNICMHPVLRVSVCKNCYYFYTGGEFSKGEDGSELYCRWCGQGGDVFCCSNCPFVFCKKCIVSNLSKALLNGIKENENWHCFACQPKVLWPLRAQHWALVNYINRMKIQGEHPNIDKSTCCGNRSSVYTKRHYSSPSPNTPNASPTPGPSSSKRARIEPSPLEPECTLVVNTPKSTYPSTIKASPAQTTILNMTRADPPPLIVRNPNASSATKAGLTITRKAIASRSTPATTASTTESGSNQPVFHTINGFRIDLNTASKQDTFRLPNGKLIQVKKQGVHNATPQKAPPTLTLPTKQSPMPGLHALPNTTITQRTPTAIRGPIMSTRTPMQTATLQQPPQPRLPTLPTSMHFIPPTQFQNIQLLQTPPMGAQFPNGVITRPLTAMAKQMFPNTPIGIARTQLQEQIFNSMEICTHLNGKIQTLTNSNAYKSVRNFLDIKELYIHISYLLTYAIGRFKGLQDKCLADMKDLGFSNDAISLENGQLAAALELVRSGKVADLEFFNLGSNTFTRLAAAEVEQDADEAEEQVEYIVPDDDNSEDEAPLEQTRTKRARLKNKNEDRRLINLIHKHAPIWNTCHKAYGNLTLLNMIWEEISTHFPPEYDGRRRWKEIRRCYARRVREGNIGGYIYADLLGFLESRNKLTTTDDEDQFDLEIIEFVKKQPHFEKFMRSFKSSSLWTELDNQLPDKQASDDDEDEIKIIEPKRDIINLDSDEDDDVEAVLVEPVVETVAVDDVDPIEVPEVIAQETEDIAEEIIESDSEDAAPPLDPSSFVETTLGDCGEQRSNDMDYDLAISANFLAGLLEVELTEGKQAKMKPAGVCSPNKLAKKKQPGYRARLYRLNKLKKADPKLRMKCQVRLERMDETTLQYYLAVDQNVDEDAYVDVEGDSGDERKVQAHCSVQLREDKGGEEQKNCEKSVENEKKDDSVIDLDKTETDSVQVVTQEEENKEKSPEEAQKCTENLIEEEEKEKKNEEMKEKEPEQGSEVEKTADCPLIDEESKETAKEDKERAEKFNNVDLQDAFKHASKKFNEHSEEAEKVGEEKDVEVKNVTSTDGEQHNVGNVSEETAIVGEEKEETPKKDEEKEEESEETAKVDEEKKGESEETAKIDEEKKKTDKEDEESVEIKKVGEDKEETGKEDEEKQEESEESAKIGEDKEDTGKEGEEKTKESEETSMVEEEKEETTKEAEEKEEEVTNGELVATLTDEEQQNVVNIAEASEDIEKVDEEKVESEENAQEDEENKEVEDEEQQNADTVEETAKEDGEKKEEVTNEDLGVSLKEEEPQNEDQISEKAQSEHENEDNKDEEEKTAKEDQTEEEVVADKLVDSKEDEKMVVNEEAVEDVISSTPSEEEEDTNWTLQQEEDTNSSLRQEEADKMDVSEEQSPALVQETEMEEANEQKREEPTEMEGIEEVEATSIAEIEEDPEKNDLINDINEIIMSNVV